VVKKRSRPPVPPGLAVRPGAWPPVRVGASGADDYHFLLQRPHGHSLSRRLRFLGHSRSPSVPVYPSSGCRARWN